MIDQGGEQLGSAARSLLDAAREGLGPDAAAVGRVRAKVAASAGAGAAIAIKVGLVGVVVALAIGAGLYSSRDHAAQTPAIDLPNTRNETSPPVVRPSAAIDTPQRAALLRSPARPGFAIDTPQRAALLRSPARPGFAIAEPTPIEMAPQSAQRTRPAVHAEGVDLAREVELIDLAMAAMNSGDAAGALATVHTHARETRGAGQLAEDAAAIEVEALCRLHDPSFAAKLDGFDANFPRSAQRSRLTTVCR